MAIRNLVPKSIYSKLWGNRTRFGKEPDSKDPEWQKWLKLRYTDFYQTTQQKGIGNLVCKMAYPVIRNADFKNKNVLEVGPGIIRHLKYMNSKPLLYSIYDNEEKCLLLSKKILEKNKIKNKVILPVPSNKVYIPIKSNHVDIIISFNTFEHLHPLEEYLAEFDRVMKSGGIIIGGVPCEGGLLWGMGRYFTTRRYVKRFYGINYDKIICWEHPNYADFILKSLDRKFFRKFAQYHPFPCLSVDLNLMTSFLYTKKRTL